MTTNQLNALADEMMGYMSDNFDITPAEVLIDAGVSGADLERMKHSPVAITTAVVSICLRRVAARSAEES